MKLLNTIITGIWIIITLLTGISGFVRAEALKEPAKYQKTPVGFTQQGHPFRGNADAPVTIEEYSDFLCPFCRRHFTQTLPALLEKYVANGKVKYVFRDFPIAKLHPMAAKGHSAALCAGEQNATFYWKMHDALFQKQKEWSQLADPKDFLSNTANEIGVDLEAFNQCIASGQKDSEVEKSIADGKALGFNGTPTFLFKRSGGEDSYTLVGAQGIKTFIEWTDSLLAGGEPPVPKPPELPFWAKPEGLQPDPDRPGFNEAGDVYKGDPEAKLVVVEFSDFQCPSCRRHVLETFPELDKRYVETGKVMWVFKHLPLKMHPHAPAAATVAECAAQQGQFWKMHHLLFEKQDDWSKGETDQELVKLAQQLNLNMPEFERCFNSRKALERVLRDIYDAQGIFKNTPAFVLLYDGKAHRILGTRTPDKFAESIEKLLGKTDGSKN